MAGRTGAIVFSTELDLAPMQRDWTRAEAIGRAGAPRVKAAIASAMKVDSSIATRGSITRYIQQEQEGIRQFFETHNASGRRFRTARDFKPAPKGKYPTPEESEVAGETRRAFRAAGAITAAHQIQRLAEAYRQAGIEAYKLGVANDNLSRQQSASAGDNAFIQRLHEIAKARADAYEQDRIHRQSLLSMAKFGGQTILNMTLGLGTPKEQDATRAKNRSEQAERAKEAISFLAVNQEKLNEAERESLDGNKRKAAILKEQIVHRERLAHLAQLEAAAGVNNPAARNAEVERSRIEVAGINRQFATREARQVRGPKASGPNAYLRNPAAYDRHPDAYDSGATRTADGKMLPGRRSGLDWFKEHPRKWPGGGTLLKSDEDTYYKSTMPGASGGIGAGAKVKQTPQVDGITRGTMDVGNLGKLLSDILGVIKAAAGGMGANK